MKNKFISVCLVLAAILFLSASEASFSQVIAGGWGFSLSVCNNGSVSSCGSNNEGALGDGTSTNKNTPVQVFGLTRIIAVSAKAVHCIALKEDGTVWTWGSNYHGQLCDGTFIDKNIPLQVNEITGVIAI